MTAESIKCSPMFRWIDDETSCTEDVIILTEARAKLRFLMCL